MIMIYEHGANGGQCPGRDPQVNFDYLNHTVENVGSESQHFILLYLTV